MKKNLIIALAGLMLFAFTQCGGSDSKDEKDKEKTVQGTPQYKDGMKALDDYEKALEKAKSCDDLNKATMDFYDASSKLRENEYGDKEKMTPEEKDKLIIRQAEITVKERKKCRQYKCDECKEVWENNDRKGSSQGSKQYKDLTKIFDDYEKAIEKAKCCDDLEKARKDFYAASLLNKEYEDSEKLTPEDEDNLIIRSYKIQVKVNQKCRKLQCEECREDWAEE